jgi:hypothetical protein
LRTQVLAISHEDNAEFKELTPHVRTHHVRMAAVGIDGERDWFTQWRAAVPPFSDRCARSCMVA